MHYKIFASPIGDIGLVWTNNSPQTIIEQVFLGNNQFSAEQRIYKIYPLAVKGSAATINAQIEKIKTGSTSSYICPKCQSS